jgi:hypothetical protein
VKRWEYYVLHIPHTCRCEDREAKIVSKIWSEEMTELDFLRMVARWNYEGHGHWQFWV